MALPVAPNDGDVYAPGNGLEFEYVAAINAWRRLMDDYGELAVANTWVGRQQVQHIVDLIRTADDTTAKTMLTFFRGAFDNTKPFFQFVTEGDGAGGVATFSLDSLNRVNIWIADENTGRLAFNTSTFSTDLDVTLTVDKKIELGADATNPLEAVTKQQMDAADANVSSIKGTFSETMGNGVSTSPFINHGLASDKILSLTVLDTILDTVVNITPLQVNLNTISFGPFGTAPAVGQYIVSGILRV